jgi:hypothetical protein
MRSQLRKIRKVSFLLTHPYSIYVDDIDLQRKARLGNQEVSTMLASRRYPVLCRHANVLGMLFWVAIICLFLEFWSFFIYRNFSLSLVILILATYLLAAGLYVRLRIAIDVMPSSKKRTALAYYWWSIIGAYSLFFGSIGVIMLVGDHDTITRNGWSDQGVGWAYVLLFASIIHMLNGLIVGVVELLYLAFGYLRNTKKL